jgi:predicted metal-dependent hydrolase
MRSKKVRIREVGEVLLERSRRAKHMILSVRPFKGIRIAVPKGQSFGEAEKFARSKIDWIKKHLREMASIEKQAAMLAERLVNRLDELSKRNGFLYNRVFVKNQKTRWGSCSARNNINLNVNLATLPDELIDYVIFHELVHTKIKNHGALFWEELSRFVTDPKSLEKKLRRYALG